MLPAGITIQQMQAFQQQQQQQLLLQQQAAAAAATGVRPPSNPMMSPPPQAAPSTTVTPTQQGSRGVKRKSTASSPVSGPKSKSPPMMSPKAAKIARPGSVVSNARASATACGVQCRSCQPPLVQPRRRQQHRVLLMLFR
ncbi:hypothetical protein DL89DRAFT_113898 [Linderina pennispora]|uniref:Uncharacterized protein n=1 Tax=Linderina pennispora TaxID=61395 RepID=A0A1Y1WG89_9FUNG|nr:uncharacterized protein DL89DRAFT_113898 [Linderina pennispora]ORX72507.1 hypothetical protein DL89DRAFT_113898 [Linderina pennispora]